MELYWIVAQEEYANAQDIEYSYSEYTEEFNKRDIKFQFLKLEDCLIKANHADEFIFLYQGIPLNPDHSAYILSKADLNPQARAISLTLRNYFRISGTHLLNECIYGIENLEWDKIAQMALARKLGAPVLPFTMCGYHKQTVPTITSFVSSEYKSFIFKPVSSGMGFGVIKSDGLQHAMSIGNLISTSSSEYFLMPFVKDAQDVRFFFISGKLCFVKFRTPQGDGYIGNVARGGKNTILTEAAFITAYGKKKFYPEMLGISKNIVEKTKNNILAVDWLVNQEGYYFNEMCTAETGLTKLPQQIQQNVFDHLTTLLWKFHGQK
ncbi:ATP-grasp domain-containing protein [Bartonella heixiaziensis]|uniref:ATP-grasp domain-containing protein n=1 Tax=Bartonella heixiaziensis TaxID=1461000 RepID=UPI003D2300E7